MVAMKRLAVWGLLGWWSAIALPCAPEVAEQAPLSSIFRSNWDEFFSGFSTPPALAAFLYKAVVPVLIEGKRQRFVRLTLAEKSLVVQSPVGKYTIRFVDRVEEEFPKLGLPEISRTESGVQGELRVCLEGIGSRLLVWQWKLRSLISADPYLFPHLTPGEGLISMTPSYLQWNSIGGLLNLDRVSPGTPIKKRANIDTPGIGKTVTAAFLVNELAKHLNWEKAPKILYTLESSDVLYKSQRTFQEVLGARPTTHLYDRAGANRSEVFDENSERVFATRTSYFLHRDAIHSVIKRDIANGQPWIIIVDEAQHRGKKEGQFQTLIEDLSPLLSTQCQLVDLSGTYWHRDAASLVSQVDGNVYGGNLKPDEQALLRAGEKLPELARTQFYRTTSQGYLSALRGLHLVRTVSGKRPTDLIRDSVVWNAEGTVKKIKVPVELIQDLARRVQKIRVRGMPDRAVIFMPSVDHANAFSREFAKYIDGEVRAYHRRPEDSPVDTFSWFSDTNAYERDSEKQKHKYVFVVRLLTEGTDVAKTNLSVVLKSYVDDVYGFGWMFQNILRADRAEAFKVGYRVLDYSLQTRWMKDGLPSILMERSTTSSGLVSELSPGVTVDEEWMTGETFKSRFYQLFPDDGSFFTKFPFFDLQTFLTGAWSFLKDRSAEFGTKNLQTDFAVSRMVSVLLKRMPEVPEKQDLMETLLDEAWGWTRTDGQTIEGGGEYPSQRLFEALYEMAYVLKVYHFIPDLQLQNLQSESEMKKVFDFLCPDFNSLNTAKDVGDFLNEDTGAFALAIDEARRWGIRNATYPEGLQEFYVRLALRLPKSPERNQLISELSDPEIWGWAANDGVLARNQLLDTSTLDRPLSRRRAMHRSYQRIYRAMYRITFLYNQAYPERALELSQIHHRSEFQKLLNGFNPAMLARDLTATEMGFFLDREKGAFAAILERYSTFAEGTFSRGFGMRNLVLGMVAQTQDATVRNELQTTFTDSSLWKWRDDDGAKASGGALNRCNLFFRAAQMIASTIANRRFTSEELITYEGLTELFDRLQHGESFRILPAVEIRALLGDDFSDYARVLFDESKKAGISEFGNNNGIKRVVGELASRLPFPERKKLEESFSHDRLWGWLKTDAQLIRTHRMIDVWRKADRAFQKIAMAAARLDSHFPVDHRRLHDPAVLSALFTELANPLEPRD